MTEPNISFCLIFCNADQLKKKPKENSRGNEQNSGQFEELSPQHQEVQKDLGDWGMYRKRTSFRPKMTHFPSVREIHQNSKCPHRTGKLSRRRNYLSALTVTRMTSPKRWTTWSRLRSSNSNPPRKRSTSASGKKGLDMKVTGAPAPEVVDEVELVALSELFEPSKGAKLGSVCWSHETSRNQSRRFK